MTEVTSELLPAETPQAEQNEKRAPARRTRKVLVPDGAGMILSEQIDDQTRPGALVALAVQQGLDIDRLEKLLEMQRRWEADNARRDFLSALSKFQSELPPIIRESRTDQGKAGKRRYASLGQINEAIRPYLYCNGLSFRFRQQQTPAGITVTCVVSHAAGHSEETTLTAGADLTGGKNPIQSIGSTITYLERYTLVAALGLTTVEDDDDGEQGKDATDAPSLTPESALELAKKAAAQQTGNASSEPVATKPQATAMASPQQVAELVKCLRQMFDTGANAQGWLTREYGQGDPSNLTESIIADVLVRCHAGLAKKAEMDAAAKLSAGNTGPAPQDGQVQAQTDGRASKEQRDRIRELTVENWGTGAGAEQSMFLAKFGYQSANSLTPSQAQARIVELEGLLRGKASVPAKEEDIPF